LGASAVPHDLNPPITQFNDCISASFTSGSGMISCDLNLPTEYVCGSNSVCQFATPMSSGDLILMAFTLMLSMEVEMVV